MNHRAVRYATFCRGMERRSDQPVRAKRLIKTKTKFRTLACRRQGKEFAFKIEVSKQVKKWTIKTVNF